MRTYEQLFIVNTAAAEADVDALLEQLSGIIKASGGNLDKTDKWGVRKLAYRVQRQSEGLYILLSFSCAAQTVRELERRLRVADLVIKFITVRMDERMKRVAKRQKRREKRLARKPQLTAPAAPAGLPGAPPPSPGAVPGAPAPGAPIAPGETLPVSAAVPAPEADAPVEAVEAAPSPETTAEAGEN